jgi:LuxR family maltose regulon positive regulatory protein
MFTALMWRQPFRDDLREIWLPGVSEMVLYGESPQLRIQYGGLLFLYYSHWIGDCAKGKALLDALSDLKDQADVPPLVQLVWYFHAGIQLFITGHIEQSRQTQKQGLRVTDEYGLRIFDSTLSSMLFYSSLLVADMEDMEIFRQRMRSTLNESSHVDVCQYHMTLAYKAVCANEVAEAREHTDRAIDAGNKCGALFFDSYAKTADALVTAHEGKFPEALALFKEVHADTRKNHFASLETASYFFEAELFLRKGELEGCLAPLRDALSLARRTGVNNPLWWRDTVMSRLFAIALAHEIETDYVRFLIRQRQLVSPDDIPVPDAWPFPVRIYTLGRFSLVIDDKPVVFKGKAPKKALELLKALIAFGGREVSTEKLTEALWPDAEGDAAYQNFTMALKRLREILAHKDALNLTEGKLTLDPRYVWVDTWAFERGAHEGDPARRAHALGLYKGLFLGNEADAPWLLSPRERLQQSCLRGLKAHGQYLEDKTEYDQAAALYEQALATDPLDETFYQGLLRCQLALGRIADATRTYQRCEAVLKEALGVGPSPQTVALFRDSVN